MKTAPRWERGAGFEIAKAWMIDASESRPVESVPQDLSRPSAPDRLGTFIHIGTIADYIAATLVGARL